MSWEKGHEALCLGGTRKASLSEAGPPCALPETLMEKRERAQGPARKDLGLVQALLIHRLLPGLQVSRPLDAEHEALSFVPRAEGTVQMGSLFQPCEHPTTDSGGLFNCRGLGVTPELLT